ncbi:MAG: metal-dependent transcriptional regulator [Winogradskyella sp.]|uniref:metal-dependent transcriptional regulator n=1 Tax=Winogradskyella sp. TaxID=1883156 RepID=UPI0017F6E264|nr:metal-dependent transcriptional regulator [Winogradskyella sp.]MBT8245809.1 metal-dependent transcriptional regulator [Winogradskyella sp.]NNK22422.1 metal-dependent transcriptional regulator [Winogradskyella sp.]
MSTTLTEENYLKAIYHISQQSKSEVSTNAIAERIDAKASSVTDMLKKLADKSLITYVKYKGVTLTETGRLTAVDIIRKHRLWEVFLVEKLNFSWDEVHDVAEQLEHIKSPKLIAEIDAFLGFPTQDPHGDPIPDKFGNIQQTNKIILSKADVGQVYTCVGVLDSSSEFLKYLDKHQIGIGTELKVVDKEEFDQSLTIEIASNSLVMSKAITTNIYVKKI